MKPYLKTGCALAVLLFILGFANTSSSAGSNDSSVTLSIARDDRILILAPHPDDEVIACGGVIQQALNIGAQVKIVYLTEGQHNPISLIVYKKKLLFKNRQRQFIELGRIRRKESIDAMNLLGIDRSRLIFLDYPDQGTRSIFVDHWGEGNEYKDSLTGLEQTIEGEGLVSHSPYLAEAILNDTENVIRKFKPTKIFCSHPLDQNSDHIAFYLFLKAALLELQNEIQKPQIYLYIVHYRHWPTHRGFHPNKILSVPKKIAKLDLNWFILKLNPWQVERKKQALMKFKSQTGYSKSYLLSFVRSNELFSDDLKTNNTFKGRGKLKRVSFHCDNENLTIDIELLKRVPDTKDIKGTFYLFGYTDKKPFKDMPKIKIGLRANRYTVYNMEYKINKAGSSLKLRPASLHLNIPLSILGNPDSIFYSLKSNLTGTRIIRWGCWRIINLKK